MTLFGLGDTGDGFPGKSTLLSRTPCSQQQGHSSRTEARSTTAAIKSNPPDKQCKRNWEKERERKERGEERVKEERRRKDEKLRKKGTNRSRRT